MHIAAPSSEFFDVFWDWRGADVWRLGVVNIEFEACISKNGLVRIEFARTLNENEKEILKVRGFRWSRSTRSWTCQSNSFYWGIEDLLELVDDPTWTSVQSK